MQPDAHDAAAAVCAFAIHRLFSSTTTAATAASISIASSCEQIIRYTATITATAVAPYAISVRHHCVCVATAATARIEFSGRFTKFAGGGTLAGAGMVYIPGGSCAV